MRLPRPTTRRLMAAVAAVAILLGGELMRRRRVACLDRLVWLAKIERECREADPSWEKEIASPRLKRGKQMGMAEALVEIGRQKREYEYVASRPRLPVPPDPPASK